MNRAPRYLAWLLMAGALASAQEPIEERVQVGLVQVTSDVLDARGRYAGDLAATDFEVLDGGEPVELRSFTTLTEPLSIVVLLDVSRSMASRMELLRRNLDGFLEALEPGDRVALTTFNHRLRTAVTTALGRPEALRGALSGVDAYGGTALHDAALLALRELDRAGGRRALFVVSDGGDDTSLLTREALVQSVREARVPLYVVGLIGAGRNAVDRDALKALSEPAGGELRVGRTAGTLAALLRVAEADLRTRYRLEWAVPDGPPGRRRIEVRVRRPGYTVLHRGTYTLD